MKHAPLLFVAYLVH